MKKVFLASSVALMLLTACQNSDSSQQENQKRRHKLIIRKMKSTRLNIKRRTMRNRIKHQANNTVIKKIRDKLNRQQHNYQIKRNLH